MADINDPSVVAEVLAIHQQYEAALVGNDVAVLDHLFWKSPDAVRFGVGDTQYGADQVAAFRRGRATLDLSRTVSNLKVVTFGTDMAVTTIEFDRMAAGAPRHGRQTQIWKRFVEGWKVVSAHVSFSWKPVGYVESASALAGLPIPPEYQAGVEANVARAATIAQSLLAFDLPDTVEMVGVFKP